MLSVALASAVNSTRYPVDAFIFVQRGLDFTVRRMHGDPDPDEQDEDGDVPSRHVSGSDLCRGLRDFGRKEYGLLARTVLGRWRVTRTEDFGHIVFAMVDAGMMHKTDQDSIADFRGVFDFEEASGPRRFRCPNSGSLVPAPALPHPFIRPERL